MKRVQVLVGRCGVRPWRDAPPGDKRHDQSESWEDGDLPEPKPQDVVEGEIHDELVEQRYDETGQDADCCSQHDDLVRARGQVPDFLTSV